MDLEYYLQDFMYKIGGEETIIYFLIGILLFSIIFITLKKSPIFKNRENNSIAAIVAIAITILSVYYLSKSQFNQIIQSYNILGFFVLFVIPFIIFGILLNIIGKTSGIRRIGWIAFGIIFVYLYQKSEYAPNETGLTIAIIVIILAIIFDGIINESLKKETSPGGAVYIPAGNNWRWN
jgi:hypothetical protein